MTNKKSQADRFVIGSKKTAVFAGDQTVWLLIESSEEDEEAFEFNGTWWRKASIN